MPHSWAAVIRRPRLWLGGSMRDGARDQTDLIIFTITQSFCTFACSSTRAARNSRCARRRLRRPRTARPLHVVLDWKETTRELCSSIVRICCCCASSRNVHHSNNRSAQGARFVSRYGWSSILEIYRGVVGLRENEDMPYCCAVEVRSTILLIPKIILSTVASGTHLKPCSYNPHRSNTQQRRHREQREKRSQSWQKLPNLTSSVET